jgi:hypothetical protein
MINSRRKDFRFIGNGHHSPEERGQRTTVTGREVNAWGCRQSGTIHNHWKGRADRDHHNQHRRRVLSKHVSIFHVVLSPQGYVPEDTEYSASKISSMSEVCVQVDVTVIFSGLITTHSTDYSHTNILNPPRFMLAVVIVMGQRRIVCHCLLLLLLLVGVSPESSPYHAAIFIKYK